MTILYRILQAIVAIATAVLLWFFVVGMGDGSVGASNILLWTIILAVPIGGLIIASRLRAHGQKVAACVLLALPAAPALLYGLFVAMIVIVAPDFR